MPFCAKHVRVWECEIVRLGFESDFCLTLPNAPILLPSISNFSSRRKRSENHTPFCAKHVKVWECEIVRLGFESDFCLTLSNAPILLPSISNFSFRQKHWESHMQFCAKDVRVWESEIVWLEFESDFCLTWSIDLILLLSVSNFSSQQKLSEKHMPLCVKHLRVWESESVWLKYESDFCLSWSIAPILSSSVSNFSSWQKLSEKHTPWCAKHLRVWESEIV